MPWRYPARFPEFVPRTSRIAALSRTSTGCPSDAIPGRVRSGPSGDLELRAISSCEAPMTCAPNQSVAIWHDNLQEAVQNYTISSEFAYVLTPGTVANDLFVCLAGWFWADSRWSRDNSAVRHFRRRANSLRDCQTRKAARSTATDRRRSDRCNRYSPAYGTCS